MKKSVTYCIIMLLIVFSMSVTTSCQNQTNTITTQPSSETPTARVKTFSISPGVSYGITPAEAVAGGRITGHFTIEGGDSNDIMFSATDPFGNYVIDPIKVYHVHDFVINCSCSGRYNLRWENQFDTFNAKLIEVTYTVCPPQ